MGIAGQWLTAQSLLEPMEQAEPDVLQWKKLHGLLLDWQGRFAEAADFWAQCATASPAGPIEYVTLYDTDQRRAWRWISQWIPVEAMRGYDLARSGRCVEGADVLDRSLRQLADGDWRKARRARTLLICAAMHAMAECGQPQRALDLYQHCRQVIDDGAEVKYHLARVYLLLDKRATARRLLHEGESLANDLIVPLEGAWAPSPYELDCLRRKLQHHRSVFGL
jgi:tetratricopeptide (TPR) repeat protein